MKANKRKVIVISSMSILGMFYQNFDFSAGSTLTLIDPVNQKSRVHHAKELLGNNYSGSLAKQAERIGDLQITIYDTVIDNLPNKYHNQSLSLTKTIINEAQANDMDPVFVMAVIKTESGFNPKARGSHGEIGLMQIKPDTGKWLAKQKGIAWHGSKTLESPIENVRIGVAYLAHLRARSSGFANKYVAAYNMGLAKVRKMYKTAKTPREYSSRVMKNYREIYKRMVASRVTAVASDN